MSTALRTWALFVGAILLLCAAMGWASLSLLRLDRDLALARRQAALEEDVRLALWRMDSSLSALVGRENGRPWQDWLLPGAESDPRVLRRFQVEGDRSIVVERDSTPPIQAMPRGQAPADVGQFQQQVASREFQARARNQQQVAALANQFAAPEPLGEATVGTLVPSWEGDRLVLGRRVSVGSRVIAQWCWLDWDALRRDLLPQVADLFPAATLEPILDGASGDDARRLAAIPARLVPGEPAGSGVPAEPSPIRLSLVVAWAFLVLAILAVALLLAGSMALSERRAAFVSAVTHELRTPLTTFRLYAEMLASGRVPDEDRRAKYFATLVAEAERLDHLVANVLAYSRLERTRPRARSEAVAVGDLLERSRDSLTERARQAGMVLDVEHFETTGDLVMLVDPDAVSRILFNLVDNACKYAARADDKRIHLRVRREGDRVVLEVADHGPGVDPARVRRLFLPFEKSARAAAESAPGVGLGLALSRRLARGMGGDLRHVPASGGGARFGLSLPAAPQATAGPA